MDAATERLADFALSAQFDEMPSDAVHECKRRIIDTFASAMNAYNEPVSRMGARDRRQLFGRSCRERVG
jgi:2-methylcitrate dehydratase PrpD